ncbi:MAG TPA: hypothetical protein VFK44_15270 [Bacillales bacterium]|nr:hypothetical protein [Bacillales bacterium]
MYKTLFFAGFLLSAFSFGYFLLGMMHLVPLWTSAPLCFFSIFFTLHCLSHAGARRKPKEGGPRS